MTTKRYIVNDGAPEWVAGRRVRPGDVLTLTDNQAAYELMRGLVRAAPVAVAAAAEAAKPKKVRRRR